MKKNYSINPYTGKPNSSNTLEGYVDPSMLKHSSNSVLSGYVDPSMLKQLKPLSIPLTVSSSFNSINQPKTIISNDSSSSYLSSIKYAQDAGAYHSYQEVTSKAKTNNQ